MNKNIYALVVTALIAALCAVGGFVKIPVFTTSAALDSAPAMLAAFLISPLFASIAASLGHIASAVTSGMPLGPLHVLIALEMLGIVYIFALLHAKGWTKAKWLWMFVGNSLLAPLPFYFIIAPSFYFLAVPGLMIATALNISVALLCAPIIVRVKKTLRQEV